MNTNGAINMALSTAPLPVIEGPGENRSDYNPHTAITNPPLIFPLRDRPEWRRDPRAITFLKTTRPDLHAAKQWIAGRKEAIDYAKALLWIPFVAFANDIWDLSKILTRAEGLPRITAVRGAVRLRSMEKATVNRRLHERPGDDAPDMEDAPRHWLMIDLDSQPETSGL